MKDPIHIGFPRCDFSFVALYMDESGGHISFALLNGFLLNRRHGSVIELKASDLNFSKHGLLVQLTASAV